MLKLSSFSTGTLFLPHIWRKILNLPYLMYCLNDLRYFQATSKTKDKARIATVLVVLNWLFRSSKLEAIDVMLSSVLVSQRKPWRSCSLCLAACDTRNQNMPSCTNANRYPINSFEHWHLMDVIYIIEEIIWAKKIKNSEIWKCTNFCVITITQFSGRVNAFPLGWSENVSPLTGTEYCKDPFGWGCLETKLICSSPSKIS